MKASSLRLLLVLAIACLLVQALPPAAARAIGNELKTVQVEGRGTTDREAEEDALRSAAEQAVGVIVQAETVTREYTVQSDRVRTQAEAFIENFEVISRGFEADGVRVVRLRATVNLGTIKDSLRALAILQKRKHNPVFAVVNAYEGEDRATYEVNVAAVGAVNKYLGSKLIEVKDPAEVERLRRDDALIQEANGRGLSISQEIANQLKADVYVTVIGHVGRSASLNVKFFESSTGRILGEESAYTSTSPGGLGEQKQAVERATLDAVDKAFATMLNYWKRDTAQGNQIAVIANGLDFKRKIAFRKILDRLGADVKQLSASAGHAEFIVWTERPIDEFTTEVVTQAEEARLKIADQEPDARGNRVIFTFK